MKWLIICVDKQTQEFKLEVVPDLHNPRDALNTFREAVGEHELIAIIPEDANRISMDQVANYRAIRCALAMLDQVTDGNYCQIVDALTSLCWTAETAKLLKA